MALKRPTFVSPSGFKGKTGRGIGATVTPSGPGTTTPSTGGSSARPGSKKRPASKGIGASKPKSSGVGTGTTKKKTSGKPLVMVDPLVPNDNLVDSFVLKLRTLPGGRWQTVGTGHNVGATAELRETAGVQSADGRQVWHGRSVWWVLQAPGTSTFEIDASTAGSAIDTTLSVVQPGGGASSNDNDRRQPTPASRVFLRRVTLKKGDKVYFSVDGVNGAQGQIKLTVKLRKLN